MFYPDTVEYPAYIGTEREKEKRRFAECCIGFIKIRKMVGDDNYFL